MLDRSQVFRRGLMAYAKLGDDVWSTDMTEYLDHFTYPLDTVFCKPVHGLAVRAARPMSACALLIVHLPAPRTTYSDKARPRPVV